MSSIQPFYLCIFFIYGLLFGSFFNVVGLRIPQKQSIIRPPSHCSKCDRKLSVFDLIPVFSFAFSRGRCRYCGERISPIYPIMELLTALLFAFVFFAFGFTPEMWMTQLFISMLIIITVSDLAYRIIPDKVVFTFAGLFLVLRLFIHPNETFLSHLIGMGLGFGIFLLIAVVSRGGMGGGDIKLMAVVGLFLGYPLLLFTILLSTFLGALYGILLIGFRQAGRRTEVPFGPFIALGSIGAIFWGYDVIQWYWKSFF